MTVTVGKAKCCWVGFILSVIMVFPSFVFGVIMPAPRMGVSGPVTRPMSSSQSASSAPSPMRAASGRSVIVARAHFAAAENVNLKESDSNSQEKDLHDDVKNLKPRKGPAGWDLGVLEVETCFFLMIWILSLMT